MAYCILLQLLILLLCKNESAAQFYVHSAKAQAANARNFYNKVVNGQLYQMGTVADNQMVTTTSTTYSPTGNDVFFIAYDINGNVRYSTLIGGNGTDNPTTFTVGNGRVYILMRTYSTNLPVTDGSSAGTFMVGGFGVAAVFVLNDTNGNIEFGTYIQGNGATSFGLSAVNYSAITLEGTNFIVTGETSSTDFATTDGSTTPGDGIRHLFIRKYNASGIILYSKVLGGGISAEYTMGTVTEGGKTYILLRIFDNHFPVTDGSNNTIGANGGLALCCVDNNGLVQFSKYILPFPTISSANMFSDASGIYIGGAAPYSPLFPATTGSPGGGTDFFAAKYSPTGSLIYARYIGGSGNETDDRLMKVDNGAFYISGETSSNNYPVTGQGLILVGSNDPVLTKLNNTGGIEYSTCYGGLESSVNENPLALDVVNGEAYLMVNYSMGPTTDGTPTGSGTNIVKFTTTGRVCVASSLKDSYAAIGSTLVQSGFVFGDKAYYGTNFNSFRSVTQPYTYSTSGNDIGAVVFKICAPTTAVAGDTINPSTQTVCKNSLVQQLRGISVFLDAATSLPLLYRSGVFTPQNNIYFDYQWQWAPSATGPWTDIAGADEKNYSPGPTNVNIYYRRLTKQNPCCGSAIISTSAVAAVLVNANNAPVADAGGGALGIIQTCPGSAVTIGGTPAASGGTAPYTYAWNNGAGTAPNPSVLPAASSVYTLTVTDALGCTQADQVLVNTYSADAGPDKVICAGVSVQIGTPVPAGATVTYNWTRISGTGTLSATNVAQPAVSGVTTTSVYQVAMTVIKPGVGNTCTTTDQVTITTSPTAPPANFAGPDRVVCLSSGTTSLGTAASPGFAYSWSPTIYLSSSTTANPTYNSGSLNFPVPNKITYTVVATNASGCTYTDQVEVAVIEARAGQDGCGPRYIGMSDRTPNLNETYQWTVVSGAGNFLGATNQPVIPVGGAVGAPVTYRLTTTYNLNGVIGTCTDDVVVTSGCSMNCSIVVQANSGCASFTLNGAPVTLKATSIGFNTNELSYSWSPAIGLSSYNTQTVNLLDTVARTYTVTITSLLDPTMTCTASIYVNQPSFTRPVFNAQPAVFACSGAPVAIGDPVSNPTYTYAWTGFGLNNNSISNPIATSSSGGDYIATVTDNNTGCKINDTVTVTRTSAANAGPDRAICGAAIVSIGSAAESGYTYLWSPLLADWRNGTSPTDAMPEPFVATTTAFILTKTHTASACVSLDTVTVTVNPTVPPFTMSPLSYCPSGTALVLGYSNGTTGGVNEVPAGLSYSWNPSSLLISSTVRNPTLKTPMPGSATTFSVTATNAFGCSQTGVTQIITPTIPSVDAGVDKTICMGSSVPIGSASNPTGGGITYSWSPATGLNNPTSPNPVFTPTAAGSYTFTVTITQGGCSGTDVVRVDVLSVNLAPVAPVTVCSGTTVTIGPASPDVTLSYFWTPSAGLSNPAIANPSVTPTTSQVYTLTATNAIGCQASQTVFLGVYSTPAPTVTVPNINTCSGTAATLNPTVSPAGTYNYSWTPATNLNSTTIPNPSVNTSVAGTQTYTVTVTNATTGCYGSGVANVTVNTCAPSLVNITGNVFADNTNDNTVNGTGTSTASGVQLYVSLVNESGIVVSSVPVSAGGSYIFSNVVSQTNYSITLSTSQGITGNNPPLPTLPAGWINTGENLGTAPGNDGNSNGILVNIVVGNTDITNANFGISIAALGDKVWLDTDQNGVQNAGEPGVAGITVTLYNSTGAAVGATLTDAYGYYLFDNLQPGNYTVGFTLPANYTFTTSAGTSTINAVNSDANTLTGRTATVTINAGERQMNVDAGIIFNTVANLNSIGDRVWYDANSNGVQNAGEPGISGVTVTLYASDGQTVISYTSTDASGNYIFNKLPANSNYIIGFSPSAGTLFTQNSGGTTPGNNTTNSDPNSTLGSASYGKTTVINTGAAGNIITGIDAGLKDDPKSSIGDFVWNDRNANGIQDPGEPGVPGITVKLYSAGPDGSINALDDVLIGTTTTDITGYYIFSNLNPDKYFITATVPPGYSVTTRFAGNNEDFDNDFAPNQYYSGVQTSRKYDLPGAQNYMSADMGIKSTNNQFGSIGDRVWTDMDANGLQDANEPGISNVSVSLLDANGNVVINAASGKPYTTITDENGNYIFIDLPAGNYRVKFSNLPAGTDFTKADAAGTGAPGSAADATNDSDPNSATGITEIISLAAGQNIASVDAGLQQGIAAGKITIGNKVWVDANNNGLQDIYEQGVPGVIVELYFDSNGDGIINGAELSTAFKTTVTDGQGNYIFGGLDAGIYFVKFVSSSFPAGYILQAGKNNAGTNDDIDSDPDPVTGITANYVLTQGEDNLSIDAGLYNTSATNSIGDRIWSDTNTDGKQDGGEPGVPGVTLNLYNAAGSLIASAVTDVNGIYHFGNLIDGNYTVGIVPPAGFTLTIQNGTVAGTTLANNSDFNIITYRANSLNLAGGTNVTDLDGGLINTRAALGDKVWYDANGDGLQGAVEAGISGSTVMLYRPGYGPDGIAGNADDAQPIGAAITNGSGNYLFTNLVPGNYQLGFGTVPSGVDFTQQNNPGDNQNNTNSDANQATGLTSLVNLISGETDLTQDAGLRPRQYSGAGDFVWYDADMDGLQDPTEVSVPGVIVTLKDSADFTIGIVIADGRGKYLFNKIPVAGGYTIIFSNLPANATFTLQTNGTATGSDADPVIGVTPPFSVVAGTINPDIDGGIVNYKVLPAQSLEAAVSLSGKTATVRWVTKNETNTDHFEVERSTDNRHFITAGTVAAMGSSSQTSNYSFRDDVSNLTGIVYYRVKLVEINGDIRYSNIVAIRLTAVSSIKIWPNPFEEQVNISLQSKQAGKVLVQFFNSAGQQVKQSTMPVSAGINQFNIDNLAVLPKGVYNIRLVLADGTIENAGSLTRQ